MKVLLVDDRRSARRMLVKILSALPDVETEEAATADEAFAAFQRWSPDLLLLDIRLSSEDITDRSGIDLLRRLRESGASTPAIMVTSLTEIAEIREAMRVGANDYVLKDELEPEMLLPIVEGHRERLRLSREVRRLRERVDRTWSIRAIVGSSPAMERVRQRIERIADSSATVLVRGETGTGKELVARALHETSARRDHPFVAVNCSTLPGTLIESLVFGHERGAFTGAERRVRGQLELAGEGTILLDEIAEMPIDLQAKLLRVLEDRRFRPLGGEQEIPLRARIIAATHVELERRMMDGRFREDLFYRLAVVTITVPPLSTRGEDIAELVHAMCAESPRRIRFTDDAVAWLQRQPWPGNVRELRNLVERVVLLAETDEITEHVLHDLMMDERADTMVEIDRIARLILALPERCGSKLRLIERAVLHHAVEVCGGNKAAAARLVGVDRKALDRRVERPEDT